MNLIKFVYDSVHDASDRFSTSGFSVCMQALMILLGTKIFTRADVRAPSIRSTLLLRYITFPTSQLLAVLFFSLKHHVLLVLISKSKDDPG